MCGITGVAGSLRTDRATLQRMNDALRHRGPDGGGLAFASELHALLAHPSVPRDVDPRAIDDYLTYLYVPSPTTAFRHVKKLQPGHLLVWQDGNVTVEPYWDVRFGEKLRLSEQ